MESQNILIILKNNFLMYDVLITGGTGFIGSKLIQNLKNSKILLISRKKIKIKNKLIKVLIYKIFLI